jgi:hypothetical protein
VATKGLVQMITLGGRTRCPAVPRTARHIGGIALTGAEPRRRPRLALDRAKAAAHVIEHRRHLGLGQIPNQPEQLLPLHALRNRERPQGGSGHLTLTRAN